MIVGRLAPSPTGLLHLGNAWAFWLAWLEARSAGGRLILRMEDIDPDRSREEFARGIRRDLAWLGLDWDEEAPPQSSRGSAYEAALENLAARGLVYPCFCTRKELRGLAGAPQVGDVGAPYPGACRNLNDEERKRLEEAGRRAAWRLYGPEGPAWFFNDRIHGPQIFTLADCGGDFALRRSDGVFAYQLAVVLDDLEAGVNSVVRGDDLLLSTPRQLYIYSLLGGRPPAYAHLPLLLDHQGERLAKRHASLTLHSLREAGLRPERVLGLLAYLAGWRETPGEVAAADPLAGFTWSHLGSKPLVLPEKPFGLFGL